MTGVVPAWSLSAIHRPARSGMRVDAVTADYLATMRMTLRAGRWIAESDQAGTTPVMVVSATLAKLYWPRESSVLGRCIQVGENPACREIVGVVDDIRFTGPLGSPLV